MAFEYTKSTITQYRSGTKDDPYIDITESKEIIHGQVLLSEIPDELTKVRITDMYEVPRTNKKELTIDEYRVDYLEGIVSFHPSLNGSFRTLTYKGRGNHFVSASRIWTKEQNGTVTETLESLVEAGQQAMENIEGVEDAITDAENATASANTATINANNAATNANTRAEEAKTQGDYAKTQGDAAKIATEGANTATTQANTARDAANTAAGVATTEAGRAKTVADSLVHKGDYNATTAYVPLNLVYYAGSTFMALQNTTGNTPSPSSAYWKKVTNLMWQNTYSNTKTYFFGDVVRDSNSRNIYMCVSDATTGQALTNTSYWHLMITVDDLVTSVNTAITDAQTATTAANQSATAANDIVDDVEELISSAESTLASVETAAVNANEKATFAQEQGQYALTQGDYAKLIAQSMSNKGSYNASTTYKPLNIISYNNGIYQNIKESTGIVPTDTEYWTLLLTVTNSTTWENISGKPTNLETTEGAQAKADLAEQNAKTYTDQALAEFEPPSTDPIIIDLPVIPDVYGVVADDTTDNTTGLQQYIDDCIARNESEIWIPAAEKPYRISGTLLIQGSINIVGEGDKSWIHSTINDKAPIKFLNASNGSIRNIKISSLADARTSSQQGAVTIQNSTDITLDKVNVTASSATGFFITGSQRVNVTACRVNGTLADGIHTTGRSKDVIITGNFVHDAGDDSISVVSYQSQTERCENVIITNNSVRDGKARGITNIGGQNVKISDNIIDGTASCGVLVHRDGNPAYNTFEPIDTTVSNNTIKRAGAVIPNVGNQNGIELGESNKTKVINNTVDGSLHRGIVVLDQAKNVTLDNNDSDNNKIAGYFLQGSNIVGGTNRASNNGEQGFLLINLSYSSFESLQAYDNASLITKNNIHIENSNNLLIGDMISLDSRSTQKIDRAFFVKTSSYIKHGKLILNKGTRPFYDTGNSNIDAYPFTSTSIPTPEVFGMFVLGQKIISSTDNKVYTWSGTAWRTDGDLYVSKTAPTLPPTNMIWVDMN